MASIVFSDVTKSFARRGRRMVMRALLEGFSRLRREDRLIALDSVSFQARDSESLAIVGRNGAGKSTVLNLIAGLLTPDSGSVRVQGRIAALLDLGAGFHPDLTGKENLFTNAALLGLTRRETEERYGSIVEFSGLSEFIDQPLRTFSSGMVVRLAFSIAVNTNPDILLVDEVLAVGDTSFQDKCVERIMKLKDSGRLFVCVSHSEAMLRMLCKRAIWLEHGAIVKVGEFEEVVAAYNGRDHQRQLQIRTA